jgi:carbon storage regulator
MLVLTRLEGESILIGDDVRLVVTRIRGNAVRIAIDAPRSTRVLRAELSLPANHSDAPISPMCPDSEE